MSLRILHAIGSVNPASGGPIEGVKQISKINEAYGHVPEVLSLDDPASPWIDKLGFKVHAMGPAYTSYGYCPRLVGWLRANRHKYDVVIINGIWGYNALGVWLALRKTNTPYYVYTHGMLDPWFKYRYPLKHVKKWLFWPWAVFPVLRDARGVMFTCEEERRLARDSFWLYDCNEIVVNYGTPGVPDMRHDYATPFLEKRPELQNCRRFVFLGRVHPKKGPDIIIRTIARLKASGHWVERGAKSLELGAKISELGAGSSELESGLQAQSSSAHSSFSGGMKLIMAGPADGAYAAELKALAAELGVTDSIVWTGMLLGDEKWGALQCAEAFVLPSHQENFGIAVAESLSVGIPVLISKSVNIWADIEADGAGTAGEDTVDSFERQMIDWLALPPAQVARMRRKARRTFRRRYTSRHAAVSLLSNIYQVMAAERIAR
jgi:glycosyltransferase involved in cell wall biosynthesis